MRIFLVIVGVFLVIGSFAQVKEDNQQKKLPLSKVLMIEGGIYVTSMTLLYTAWYKNYPNSGFHFFNDNKEWLQMDKVGHGVTSYYVGKYGMEMLRDTDASEKEAIWYGGLLGFSFLAGIEVLDGFSEQWGASTGDIIANFGGAGLLIGQEYLWKEQRLSLKYSFHQTRYAKYRPELLGNGLFEEALKDYNGHTYWLNFHLNDFLRKEHFPNWLCLSLGYSADGMTGGFENIPAPNFSRKRQYFLSVDCDLSKIKSESKLLKQVARYIGYIKFPAPAIEFGNGVKFHSIYF